MCLHYVPALTNMLAVGVALRALSHVGARTGGPLHTHARMHGRTHGRTHARTHAQAHGRTHGRTHARTHANVCVCS